MTAKEPRLGYLQIKANRKGMRFVLKKLAAVFCAVIFLFSLTIPSGNMKAEASSSINNASLMPAYVPDSQVKMEGISPDWVKTLIMAEVRVETATSAGTFQSATQVLDHYAEMGVNGLWITPIYDRKGGNNGYGNLGPDTVWSKLTGKSNYNDSWKVVKDFVDQAHKRNIRIFFDIITWGTEKGAPLFSQHPDWYKGESFNGNAWNWSNTALRSWFVDRAVDVVTKTGADGLRCDVEPGITGYDIYKQVRQKLLAKGRKVAILSEHTNERKDTYDFEEWGVDFNKTTEFDMNKANTVFLDTLNIVNAVKSGEAIGSASLQNAGKGGMARFYTFMTTCHDDSRTTVNGNRLMIGYQAILAPFIPLWWIGDEWNNPKKTTSDGTGVLYFNTIDWSKMDSASNRAFYEDVKKMIRIRRQYPDIFNYFPDNHRNANICNVKVTGTEGLQGYARYAKGTGILVVPNNNLHDTAGNFKITIPFADMGMTSDTTYTVTELMTGQTVASGKKASIGTFSYAVPDKELRVFLVNSKESAATAKTAGKTTSANNSISGGSSGGGNGHVNGSGSGSGNDGGSNAVSGNSGSTSLTGSSDSAASGYTDSEESSSDTSSLNSSPNAATSAKHSSSAGWVILAAVAAVILIGGAVLLTLYKTGRIFKKK